MDKHKIKRIIRKTLRFVFSCIPHKTVYANVVQLSPTESLKGRTALVTGGTSGIGFAICQAILRAGANVIFTGRSEERCAKALNELKLTEGIMGEVSYEVMDNSKPETFDSHLSNIFGKYKDVSILVNNAGVISGGRNATELENYDAIMDTNLKGTYFLSHKVARYMSDHKIEGNILSIASSSSLRPANNPYCLAKWGIRSMTLGLAKMCIKHGIVVNAVAPGPTATKMLMGDDDSGNIALKNPLGRFATADEIANMVVVMTSDMGRTMVGSIVYMTGGSGVITYDDTVYEL